MGPQGQRGPAQRRPKARQSGLYPEGRGGARSDLTLRKVSLAAEGTDRGGCGWSRREEEEGWSGRGRGRGAQQESHR